MFPSAAEIQSHAEKAVSPVLFVSDVHLQESLSGTAEAFFSFLERHAAGASALYLLGDIFEYWPGDDDLAAPFHRRVAQALKAVSLAGVKLFWIAGNRDFLVGRRFAQETGIELLPDPQVVSVGGKSIVLSHGDALCTDDTAYMAFRKQVRNAGWQEAFLAKPLDERKAIIASLRKDSREAQRTKMADIMDVNADAVASLYRQTGTQLMIHGHTHRPACHGLRLDGAEFTRWVLPDWDCEHGNRRGGWIAADTGGRIQRFTVDGTPLG